jgi:signal transduction histidine kinase
VDETPDLPIPRILRPRYLPFAAALAIVLAGALVYIDIVTWIELDIAVLYDLPLFLAAIAGRRQLMWGLVAVLLSVTFIVYALQIPPGTFSIHEPFFINRVLDAVAVLLTGVLLHMVTLAVEQIRRQNEQIKTQNEELERRRREAELASERKTRLLASVSHDISTPLTSMNLIAQLIRGGAEQQKPSGDVSGLARMLESNTQSLGELVSDLLELSSIDSGRLEVRESVFSLNELLRDECRLLEALAQAKGLRLAAEPGADIRIRTDRIKLARVVRNLLSNAIKFTEKGGVSVSCTSAKDDVLIRVADTGIGIAREHLEGIFSEFKRLPDARNEQNGGWGLGLAICKRLTELLGGRIAVESEPGRGSVFTVQLPARVLERELAQGEPARASFAP